MCLVVFIYKVIKHSTNIDLDISTKYIFSTKNSNKVKKYS